MKITLSSCYKDRPRVHIDMVKPPENLEEIVQTYFHDFTSGTNPEYMDDDKLAYIDLIRAKVHPEKGDAWDAAERLLVERFKYDLENCGYPPDASEYWNVSFFSECYESGDMKLYDKQYGWKHMDHHVYDKIHHTLVRIIKAVVNYEADGGDHDA